MLVLFSLWQQVVWGGWGCSMRSLKKCSGVLDLTRLPPPFLLRFPGTLQTECWRVEHRGEQKDKGYVRLPVWHFWFFQFIFTSPSFVRPPSKMCVPLLTFISFSSQRDDTAHVLYVFTQSYLTHAFPWMWAAFRVPLAFHSLSLSGVLVPFSNWPDAFMCLNAQPELVCAAEAMHQCCHWQNVHLL